MRVLSLISPLLLAGAALAADAWSFKDASLSVGGKGAKGAKERYVAYAWLSRAGFLAIGASIRDDGC
jgi:hypothetical protein